MRVRLIATALFSSIIIALSAQTVKKDSVKADFTTPTFRAEAGYGQTFRTGNYIVTAPYHVIRGGLNVEFPIKWGLGVETGLKYSYAFGKRTQVYAHNDTSFHQNAGHFLDVPLRLTYTLPIFWGMKFFAFAGPNINIGLSQTEKVRLKQATLNPAPTNPLNYPASGTYNLYENDLSRFNIQLGVGGGLQWKDYRIKSGYDWGINNVSKNGSKPQNMKGWYVAFEYVF